MPTLKESGVDVDADAWNGIIAPGGRSAAIVAQMNKDIVGIVSQPAARDKLATQLMEVVGSSPEEFRARIQAGDRQLDAGHQGGGYQSELRRLLREGHAPLVLHVLDVGEHHSGRAFARVIEDELVARHEDSVAVEILGDAGVIP